MVVLSMLALFLLLGTAFLVSSKFYQTTGQEAAKVGRTQNNPADLMERAMLQVLRDTGNPNSAIRYHSLLRDVYGTDGFIGQVFYDTGVLGLSPQYSGAYLPNGTGGFNLGGAGPLGATQGQFIDVYVADNMPGAGVIPNSSHVIAIERDSTGLPINTPLSRSADAYAGCIFTMLNGPAAGQSTRIISSEVVQISPAGEALVRLRMMAFPKSDGQALTADGNRVLTDLVNTNIPRGYDFMVNGRAHNGTGAGYNRLAAAGTPRLSTVEAVLDPTGSSLIDTTELALTPNYQFYPTGLSQFTSTAPQNSVIGHSPSPGNFIPFGNRNTGQPLYISAEGPGGSDESYDIADYQNMFLAHMPLVPVAQGGLVGNSTGVLAPGFDQNAYNNFYSSNAQSRYDLENCIVPSFHRPALINYWFYQMAQSSWITGGGSPSPDEIAAALMLPYGPDAERALGGDEPTNVTTAVRDLIVGIKRKVSLRPLREDHPNFDGSNPASRYSGTLSPVDGSGQPLQLVNGTNIVFPFWEAVGPWDVDNDNDGVNDSIWVDLGDPVQETEDGRLFKPLYAFLVVDLDNRLNVNTHGSPDHFAGTNFDPVNLFAGGNRYSLANNASSNLMPVGMGWGPGEISLRAILSPYTQPYQPAHQPNYANPLGQNPIKDDYARLLFGRSAVDPFADAIWGRNGSTSIRPNTPSYPGRQFDSANINGTRDPLTQFNFAGYPTTDRQRAERYFGTFMPPSNFGSSPDPRGRYAIGVDYTGQPIYEAVYDYGTSGNPTNPSNWPQLQPIYDDSAYETYTGADGRRGIPAGQGGSDDALFSTSDLERILRAYDGEAGTAPSRLYEVVDTFDPNKYVLTIASNSANPTPPELAFAQSQTAINRGEVTTDSYEVPVPADVVPSYITELGPDGEPGNGPNNIWGAAPDDDGNSVTDEPVPFDPGPNLTDPNDDVGEIGFFLVDPNNSQLYMAAWSDDFASYTGKSVANARLVDVLWYRIQRDRERRGLQIYNWNNPQAVAILNDICEQLLPPEVLAGYKMDLNRPFGDGKDSPDATGAVDLVVDNPAEAGEPTDGNGKWIDLNGNTFYDAPSDSLWDLDPNTAGDQGVRIDPTMGIDVARPVFVDDGSGGGIAGNGIAEPGELRQPQNLRNDSHLARQLYARHLYVLMLLLSDEDYLAPYDPYDPSVRGYLRLTADRLGNPASSANRREARRRYTCRQVAQWAVNCVDFRDPDAANTPFEFDMNPWDGWGCTDGSGTYYPLDGDAATDENHRQYVDWASMGSDGRRVITNPVPTYGQGGAANRLPEAQATRGLVWGAERPELLISETNAFHDLRVEYFNTGDDESMDDEPDQRLQPRGSLFVEVYNPWSNDGPKPVELYWPNSGLPPRADIDGDGYAEFIEGVRLDRLSNVADAGGRRSPVWRLVVVEEHPGYHPNQDDAGPDPYQGLSPNNYNRDDGDSFGDNLDQFANPNPPEAGPREDYFDVLDYANQKAQSGDDFPFLAPVNLDWDDVYWAPPTEPQAVPPTSATVIQPASQWQQQENDTQDAVGNDIREMQVTYQRTLFSKPYPYIEREFYFNSGGGLDDAHIVQPGSEAIVAPPNGDPQQRVYSDFEIGSNTLGGLDRLYNNLNVRIPFNYIQTDGPTRASVSFRFIASEPNNLGVDEQIAPILPGRYAVIGDSGTAYDGTSPFVTTIGRQAPDPTAASNPPEVTHDYTEDDYHFNQLGNVRRFIMSPSVDPTAQQWLVENNGGMYPNGGAEDDRANEWIVDGSNVNMTDTALTPPPVAIPVDDMNISEPAIGYGVREREVHDQERGNGETVESLQWDPTASNGEGAYVLRTPPATPPTDYKDTAHYDVPFDIGPEFQEAWDKPRSYRKYRVVHLQRLADPTMPWNPPPGYNAHNSQLRAKSGHDNRLPVNPYLTVDSMPVDLTVFNGTSNPNDGAGNSSVQTPDQETTYGSIERMQTSLGAGGTNRSLPVRGLYSQDGFHDGRKLNNYRLLKMPMANQQRTSASAGTTGTFPNHLDYFIEHSLGLPNHVAGTPILTTDTQGTPGAPRTAGPTDPTFPWMNWNNRPFISEKELLQVPAWGSMELLRKFSGYNTRRNAAQQVSPYDGGVDENNVDDHNLKRYQRMIAAFGHLMNFMQTSTEPAEVQPAGTGNFKCVGAPNYHRLLDYVHVPSRFVGTDTLLNPVNFNPASAVPISGANDPRQGHLAPFNRVPNYREPGKINLNTVRGQRLPTSGTPQLWSDVYDGLMHRVRDADALAFGGGVGHVGPAWRDLVVSRRGYPDAVVPANSSSGLYYGELVLDNTSPTFFANPFREGSAAELVPLPAMMGRSVDSGMTRPHYVRPSDQFAWGTPNNDDGGGLINDTREAGYGGDSNPFTPVNPGMDEAAEVPLFSELSNSAFVDGPRNSAMHYMPLTRLDNLTTTRSGVFAVWVTVGYFEVTDAPPLSDANVRQKFLNQTGNDAARAEALYNRVYPQGYTLGQELGADTGDIERHRSFYIIDRTRPVAFKPGEDVNVENAILLRRRID